MSAAIGGSRGLQCSVCGRSQALVGTGQAGGVTPGGAAELGWETDGEGGWLCPSHSSKALEPKPSPRERR